MRERDHLPGLSVLHYIGGVTEYNKITTGLSYTTDSPIHVGSYLYISTTVEYITSFNTLLVPPQMANPAGS
jgi:hypothetical protein